MADGTRPNVIFVLTDDQGYGDLSWQSSYQNALSGWVA
jgi:arylsulfatase A-like enzyme